jgi:DNA-binding MarR family transcriptional regulator
MPATAAAAPPPPLDDFLCFAIYSANLAFGRAYKPVLEAAGLGSYTQYIALVALYEQDDQSVGELGERMFLESNTLTPILKKLEQLGYITRRRDAADERQVRVRLTPQGRRLRERVAQTNLRPATGLDPDEFKAVQNAVVKVRDNLLRATRGG